MTESARNNDAYGRVAVLMGGRSAEREISLLSGQAVFNALKRAGIDVITCDPAEQLLSSLLEAGVDRVFIMLHGRHGEDGTVQGALDMMGLPYTGSGVLASALALDKVRTKKLWLYDGLPTPPFEVLTKDTDFAGLIERFGTVFVKPVNEGSSIGIGKASSVEELKAAWLAAAAYDDVVLAERWIEGREFSVPIMGDRVLPAIELQTDNVFYDYEAKYLSESTRYICPCELEQERLAELNALAMSAYKALGCTGWGRVDVMQDSMGAFWLLEVNTVPGMTDHSLVPMSAAVAGMDFDQLVLNILDETDHREAMQ